MCALIGWVAASASCRIARSRQSWNSSHGSQLGWIAASERFSLEIDPRVRVGQQRRLAEEDRARVLHRAGQEIGHRHQVELAVGVGDPEVAFVELELLLRLGEREPAQRRLARRGPNAHRRLARQRVHLLERPHRQRHQVGRQRRRLGELHHLDVGRAIDRLLDHRPVRHRPVRRIDARRHLEARLDRRLVEAGEGAPRLGGLEVGEGEAIAARLGQVEPGQLIGQLAVPLQLEARLARRQRPGKAQGRRLRLFVELHLGHVIADGGAGDGQLGRVERHDAGRLGHAQRDAGAPVEGGAAEVRAERDLVALGDRLERQTGSGVGGDRPTEGAQQNARAHGPHLVMTT
jgi:hypothetical protein